MNDYYLTLNETPPTFEITIFDAHLVIHQDLRIEMSENFINVENAKEFGQFLHMSVEFAAGVREASAEMKARVYTKLLADIEHMDDPQQIKEYIKKAELVDILMR